jgi:hypothetical protein
MPADAELVLPEQVTIALAELAGAAQEGLLALAVGTGIAVLGALLAADVERLVGPKGRHNPTYIVDIPEPPVGLLERFGLVLGCSRP